MRASETDILVPARAGGETNSRGKRRRLPHQYSTFQSKFPTDFPKFHPLGYLPKRNQRRENQLIAWKSIISFCQNCLCYVCPPILWTPRRVNRRLPSLQPRRTATPDPTHGISHSTCRTVRATLYPNCMLSNLQTFEGKPSRKRQYSVSRQVTMDRRTFGGLFQENP